MGVLAAADLLSVGSNTTSGAARSRDDGGIGLGGGSGGSDGGIVGVVVVVGRDSATRHDDGRVHH